MIRGIGPKPAPLAEARQRTAESLRESGTPKATAERLAEESARRVDTRMSKDRPKGREEGNR